MSAYPPAKIRSLYRQVLTLLHHTPPLTTSTTTHTHTPTTAISDRQQIAQQMRKNAALTSPDDIIIAVKQLMDKLTLLKFSTPKHLHRSSNACNNMQVDSILNLAKDRQKLAHADNVDAPSSQSWYVDADGNMQEGHSPSRYASSRANRAELGVTSEEIRRHQALTERMQFRGPHWERKAQQSRR